MFQERRSPEDRDKLHTAETEWSDKRQQVDKSMTDLFLERVGSLADSDLHAPSS